jgi:CheY-like chemotaxis protein
MKMKILIVDDNSDTLEVLSLRVTQLGYEAIKAHNSQEAIAYAEAEPPDLIFMDMDLPDVDGAKTTAILKQNPKTSYIPVVAVTAWMSDLWREKALKVGIVSYLLKPVAPQTLKQTIEQFTNRSLNPTDMGRLREEEETELGYCGKPKGLKALNRLRMCLIKLKRPCGGSQRVEAYFTLYPRDR